MFSVLKQGGRKIGECTAQKSHCVNSIWDHRKKKETGKAPCPHAISNLWWVLKNTTEVGREMRQCLASLRWLLWDEKKKKRDVTPVSVPINEICNRKEITPQGIFLNYGFNYFKKYTRNTLRILRAFTNSKNISSATKTSAIILAAIRLVHVRLRTAVANGIAPCSTRTGLLDETTPEWRHTGCRQSRPRPRRTCCAAHAVPGGSPCALCCVPTRSQYSMLHHCHACAWRNRDTCNVGFCFGGKTVAPDVRFSAQDDSCQVAYLITSGLVGYTACISPSSYDCTVCEEQWLSWAALWTDQWIHVGRAEARQISEVMVLSGGAVFQCVDRCAELRAFFEEYCIAFHRRLVSASPVSLGMWPTDAEVPLTEFGELMLGVQQREQQFVGMNLSCPSRSDMMGRTASQFGAESPTNSTICCFTPWHV